MSERLITPDVSKEAALARYDASDLAALLAVIGSRPHVPEYLDALHARWAWEIFDKLAVRMASIPRPEGEGK